MTDEDKQTIQAMLDAMAAHIQEAQVANLSELRRELMDHLERIERRTERTEINVNAILMQLAGMSKSLTAAEQLDSATAGTLAAMQQTITDLARRVALLERKAS